MCDQAITYHLLNPNKLAAKKKCMAFWGMREALWGSQLNSPPLNNFLTHVILSTFLGSDVKYSKP